MLSTDTSDLLLANNNSDIPSIAGQNGVQNQALSDNDGIYLLPTVVTRVQRELFEINIRLFSDFLLQEVSYGNQRTSIDSLLENSDENAVSSYEKLNLLFEQLSRINRHPTLIVDHFIPKNLLLLEINEKLISFSGKMQLFNRIIDSMISENSHIYHVLVIAESVKELELIESIIIGKKIYYNNMSNDKLYNDNRNIPDFKNPKTNLESSLCLHLISSLQLYNNYIQPQNMDSTAFSFIFSFDANIDPKSPSIEVLRENPLETPILIPTPVYSLEHIIKEIPKPAQSISYHKDRSSPDFKWKLKVINTFIVNRFRLYETSPIEFFLENYGFNMKKVHIWLNQLKKYSNPLKRFNDNLNLHFSKEKLIKKISLNYSTDELDYTLHTFDYKSYKGKIAELINEVVLCNQKEIENNLKPKISKFRLKETERQTHFDDDEDKISDSYRKLRKLNETALVEERKLARIDLEETTYQEKLKNFQGRLEFMEKFCKENIEKEKLEGQERSLKELKEKYESLTSELELLDQECSVARLSYQDNSTKAVGLSRTLAASKDKNSIIVTKLNDPGNKILPSLFKKDELLNYEMELTKLKRQNDFIAKFYANKLEKTVTERYSVVEASSNTSNGRNSNRISRASTPF